MTTTAPTHTEAERLDALRRYDILDTPPDGAFDRIAHIAADSFGLPISMVSLVDEDRIWFKSHHGVDVQQIERVPGLCSSVILQENVWVVEDARTDPRTLSNPLVCGDFGLQFYAGAPIRTHDGFNLGSVAVIGLEPRTVSDREQRLLEDLAAIVIDEMELRLAARRAAEDIRVRQRAALELNDDVVQGLAVAKMALEMADADAVDRHLTRSLDSAKRILSEMSSDLDNLRRRAPASGAEATAAG